MQPFQQTILRVFPYFSLKQSIYLIRMDGDTSRNPPKLLLPRVGNHYSPPHRPSLSSMMQMIQSKKNEHQSILTSQGTQEEELNLQYLKKAEMDEDDPLLAIVQPNIYRVRAEEKLCAGTQRDETVHHKTKRKKRILLKSVVGAAFAHGESEQTHTSNKNFRYGALNSQGGIPDVFSGSRDSLQFTEQSGSKKQGTQEKEETGRVEQMYSFLLPTKDSPKHQRYNETRILINAQHPNKDDIKLPVMQSKSFKNTPTVEAKGTISDNIIGQALLQVRPAIMRDEAVQTVKPIAISRCIGQSRQWPLRVNSEGSSSSVSSLPKQIKKAHTRTKTQAIQPQKTDSNYEQQQAIREAEESSFDLVMYSLKRISRGNQKIERAVAMLEKTNPFFRRLPRVVGVCLLQIGRTRLYEERERLYDMGQACSSFFIILKGSVKIKGRFGLHRVCETGETLLEQILPLSTTSPPERMAMQRAKTLERSWLLQVRQSDLGKLEGQLLRFGMKQSCTELWTLFKRNHIVKTWLRNKFNTTYRP